MTNSTTTASTRLFFDDGAFFLPGFGLDAPGSALDIRGGSNVGDSLHGDAGPDLFFGGAGNDVLIGGGGRDALLGEDGDDRLHGGAGGDLLFGGTAADLMGGGAGRDLLFGQAGDDRLHGGADQDRLFGGSGQDVLTGGRGNDQLTGGAGRDQFVFNPDRTGEGHDRISDFQLGQDRIVLDAAQVLASDPSLAGAIVAGGGTVAAVFAALDASEDWDLREASNGDLIVAHPTGTIRLAGVDAQGIDSFADLSGALAVRGLGSTLAGLADQTGQPATVAALVAASGSGPDSNPADFDLLLAALDAAGLTAALADPDADLSVFAPTDAAFVSLATRLGFGGGSEQQALDFILNALDGLGDPVALLTDVLTYHVAPGARTLGELNLDGRVDTLFADADVTVRGDRLVDQDPDFGNPQVISSDVITGNGVVQVINEVLLPFDL